VSRLALVKLEGAATFGGARKAGRTQAPARNRLLAASVLVLGLSVACATWIGGGLVDVRETMAEGADAVASGVGFAARDIQVLRIIGVDEREILEGARADEIRAEILPEGRTSLLSADPKAVLDRVEKLDWVEYAQVRRKWPNTVEVSLVKRQAAALWQRGDTVTVVDLQGRAVPGEAPWTNVSLPLVVGAGAGPAAGPLIQALEERPGLRKRLAAAVFVNERRWNLKTKDGLEIVLPAGDAAAALSRFDLLDQRFALLARPLARVDLRDPTRIAILPRDVLAGGPGAAHPNGARRLTSGA
jgi:cell division protein FtsQ